MSDNGAAPDAHPLAAQARQLPLLPGVYRFLDARQQLLYVGKAKALRRRVQSYFRSNGLSPRIAQLMRRAVALEVTVTETEVEALLLEQNLIKAERPPYNILLRDDKSYPYILLSEGEPFPRLTLHRGARREGASYFGPYPSAVAARDALNLLQKVFRVRQCENSFFNNRSRPCLQHQINRCTAPCVGLVSEAEYAEQVALSRLFLQGRSEYLVNQLQDRMQTCAENQRYEEAAHWRDRIQWLREVQTRQAIEAGEGNLDIVALAVDQGLVSAHVLFVREGRVLGSRNYSTGSGLAESVADALEAFLAQFYLGGGQRGALPDEIIMPLPLPEDSVLPQVLAQQAGRPLRITHSVRSARRRWLQLAQRTAQENLALQLGNRQMLDERFADLQQALALPEPLQRIECFDISHHQGTATVAACVVFSPAGAERQQYRRFTMRNITAGDDYAAIEQAVRRRYSRLRDEGKVMPSLVLIDGGEQQLKRACLALDELGLGDVPVIGIAKGVERRAGLERLFWGAQAMPLPMPAGTPGFLLLQQVRDEAHRFAVAGHHRRQKAAGKEQGLDAIDGIGPKRKKALLQHFGGRQGVMNASLDDLLQVPGINRTVAQAVYDALHAS